MWQTRPGVRARHKRKAPRLCAGVGLLAETATTSNEASKVQRETPPHQMSPKQTGATQAEAQAHQTRLGYAYDPCVAMSRMDHLPSEAIASQAQLMQRPGSRALRVGGRHTYRDWRVEVRGLSASVVAG